jgi:hypothetical protein
MTRLRGACDPKPTCPTLYLTDRATVIVQGWVVTDTAVLSHPPALEGEVEVPVSLLWVTPSAASPQSPVLRLTGRDTAIVRGHLIDDAQVLARLSLPDGETAIEAPISLLPEVVPSAH